MANSTTNIDTVVQSQASKEVTINAFFDACSPATVYGRRASTTSGLTWGYYGGNVTVSAGTMSQIANGTLTLTASNTNYIVAAKSTGAVSVSTANTNWLNTTDYWRLYSVVTGAATVTSYTDARQVALYTGMAFTGAMIYQGSWDASTNTPTLASGTGTKGYYYVVSVSGTTTIDGVSLWTSGDIIAFNGAIWQKIDASLSAQEMGNLINSSTEKTTPVDADMLGLMDSAAGNILKKLSWANVKATLKTYFDALYQAASATLTTWAGVTPGTGVADALKIAIGTAGSFITNGGALGTPASGTVTNLTGTASININGTVGATTAATGKFTTLTFGESQTRLMSSKFAASTTGFNLFIGGGGQSVAYDGGNASTGSFNTSCGVSALQSVTTGYFNAALGTSSLYALTTGIGNMGIGFYALYNLTTAGGNTAIGHQAGRYTNAAANNTTSSNSVYIGYDTRASADGNTNEVVIGYNGRGNGSNTTTLGNSSTTDTYLAAGKLHVPTGILFGTDTAAANTLDDYEEGLLAGVTITCGTSGTVTLDTTRDTLSYTKIGSWCHLQGRLLVASVSSPVGYFKFSLPFATANIAEDSDNSLATIVINGTNAALPTSFAALVGGNSTEIYVYLASGTGVASTSANELKTNTEIIISLSYRTA